MTENHDAAKRATLQMLGTLGAGIVLVPIQAQEKPESAVEIAAARFEKGHSCAQAVCSALAERLGTDYETAMKVAGGFGGGMYLNSVCGAVTGGIMAIGLKHGGVGTPAGIRTATMVRDFAARFKAAHKAINCSELIGRDLSAIDISNPDVLQAAYKEAVASGAFARCGQFVSDATRIAAEMLSV